MTRQYVGSIALIALCLVAVALPAVAQCPPLGPPPGPQGPQDGETAPMPPAPPAFWKNSAQIEQLQLKSEQIKALQESDFALREKQIKLRAELDLLELKLEKAFEDKAKDAVILDLANKIGEQKSKLFISEIEMRLNLNKILSAEQLRKLERPMPPGGMDKRMPPPDKGPR